MSVNILIAFYSRLGSTELLAQSIAEGASAAGATVRLRRARELVDTQVMRGVPGWLESATRMNDSYNAPSEADAEWADGIVFGTPTRFGSVSSELKAYIDSIGGIWFKGRLNGKAGSVFTSSSTPHGGNESTLVSMYPPLAHLGLVIVPLGYADATMFKAGTPYGASSVSGMSGSPPTTDDLEVARFQGRRVCAVSAALKVGGPAITSSDGF
jgi:NAD(P)H dehydrogenase (quinone)